MPKDNGGPAFPRVGIQGLHREPTIIGDEAPGITLKDYFAGQVMPILVNNYWTHSAAQNGESRFSMPALTLARAAYAIADAMIDARAE